MSTSDGEKHRKKKEQKQTDGDENISSLRILRMRRTRKKTTYLVEAKISMGLFS